MADKSWFEDALGLKFISSRGRTAILSLIFSVTFLSSVGIPL
jgi:hypothetical protein